MSEHPHRQPNDDFASEVDHALRSIVEIETDLAHSAMSIERAKGLLTNRPRSVADRLNAAIRLLVAARRDDAPPLAMGFRGGVAPTHTAFDVEGAEIHLRVVPPPTRAQPWVVLGQIDASPDAPAMRVELAPIGADKPCAEADVSPDGVFAIDTNEGVFDLLVHFSDRVALIPSLEVG
jgi:hypothetical protein